MINEDFKPLKYFKIDDFACKCGCGKNIIKNTLLAKLDIARELAGVPFLITSGCRCEKHNAEIKNSAINSPHMQGIAADIACNDSANRFKILKALFDSGFTGIAYGKGFVHCDVRKNPMSWTY